jgi:large subunit ribosomal protein L4
MPGGGTMFGPEPRDYSYSLPKKVRQAGLRSALSYLVKEGRLTVVDAIKSEGKTGEMAKRLKGFGVEKTVLMDAAGDQLVARATRNMKKVRYYGVEGLNVYDLLKYDNAIITKAAIAKIVQRCGVEA